MMFQRSHLNAIVIKIFVKCKMERFNLCGHSNEKEVTRYGFGGVQWNGHFTLVLEKLSKFTILVSDR